MIRHENSKWYSPSLQQIAWAELVLRTHCHGEIWLWREGGVAFEVDKKQYCLFIAVSVPELWWRVSYCTSFLFSRLGWRIEALPSRINLSCEEFEKQLAQIHHEATGKAGIYYGKELVRRLSTVAMEGGAA